MSITTTVICFCVGLACGMYIRPTWLAFAVDIVLVIPIIVVGYSIGLP